ncbi:Hypothetical protein Minf_2201 [Methylacidiphilum infernorum V4]|uniref:Uncharacterized protein n=1 Tax=Methylacidiphilum infernorum (isolate V4) TaxID=481448 RepID=B3DZS0_METI4|nr:Hypothetical protein Minf_2201 [Methylacidiphilum infernorum V4]
MIFEQYFDHFAPPFFFVDSSLFVFFFSWGGEESSPFHQNKLPKFNLTKTLV